MLPVAEKRLAENECFAGFQAFLTKYQKWDSDMFGYLRQLCESAETMDDAFATLSLAGLMSSLNGGQGEIKVSYIIFTPKILCKYIYIY